MKGVYYHGYGRMEGRMAKRIIAAIVVLSFLLVGCGSSLAQESMSQADQSTPAHWLNQEYTEESPSVWAKNTLDILAYQDAYGVRAAVESWLGRTVWKDREHKAYLLTLPDLEELGAKGLPKYEGQEPLGYLMQFSAALSRQLASAPAKKPVEIDLLSGYDMVLEVKDFLADLDAHLLSAWKKMRVYRALSRICMPLAEAQKFQSKQFDDDAQAPLYKKAAARKVLNMGDKGDAVQNAQQALIDRGYLEGKTKGVYDEGMANAVALFQKDTGLPVGGSQLTLDAQTYLLGREDSYPLLMDMLAEELVSYNLIWNDELLDNASGVRGLLDARFPLFLRTVSHEKWNMDGEGLSLSYQIIPMESLTSLWYDEMVKAYMSLDLDKTGMENELVSRVAGLWSNKDLRDYAQDGQIALAWDAPSLAITGWAPAFASFHQAYEGLLQQMRAYTEDNMPPLPMPKSKVLTKPISGSSRFVIKNQGEMPVYARVYQMSGLNDTEKGSLIGSAFIRTKGKATMSIAPGFYRITYGAGEYWYGEEAMFGEYGTYLASKDIYQFESRYIYTLTLSVENVSPDEGVTFNGISPDAM